MANITKITASFDDGTTQDFTTSSVIPAETIEVIGTESTIVA